MGTDWKISNDKIKTTSLVKWPEKLGVSKIKTQFSVKAQNLFEDSAVWHMLGPTQCLVPRQHKLQDWRDYWYLSTQMESMYRHVWSIISILKHLTIIVQE
jgi:hypothetical protein